MALKVLHNVVGGNLWQIAEIYLGDATMAIQLLALNGLQDPFLTGINSIVLPAPGTPSTNGLPPQ